MNHFAVQQKLTQHCKSTMLQLTTKKNTWERSLGRESTEMQRLTVFLSFFHSFMHFNEHWVSTKVLFCVCVARWGMNEITLLQWCSSSPIRQTAKQTNITVSHNKLLMYYGNPSVWGKIKLGMRWPEISFCEYMHKKGYSNIWNFNPSKIQMYRENVISLYCCYQSDLSCKPHPMGGKAGNNCLTQLKF